MNIDMRADAPNQTDIIDPEKLSTEIEKLKSVQDRIKSLEDQIKDLKEDENLSSLKLKDGSELTVKQIYSASIKADKKAQALNWLRENGLGDIVKNEITVNFGQNEDNKAVEYVSLARERGYEPSQKETVHHASLSVVMKEWKEKGNEVPADLFNILEGNRTSMTNKK